MLSRRATTGAFALALVGLTGCAGVTPLACPGGTAPRLVAELLFGRNIGSRLAVSETDWARFVAEEVTPRFPDGFTVVDAKGQWRDSEQGRVVREPSKMLLIVMSDEAAGRGRLAAIIEAYKRRFSQQSVLTILRSACVSF